MEEIARKHQRLGLLESMLEILDPVQSAGEWIAKSWSPLLTSFD